MTGLCEIAGGTLSGLYNLASGAVTTAVTTLDKACASMAIASALAASPGTAVQFTTTEDGVSIASGTGVVTRQDNKENGNLVFALKTEADPAAKVRDVNPTIVPVITQRAHAVLTPAAKP